jgi:hypothetical protein
MTSSASTLKLRFVLNKRRKNGKRGRKSPTIKMEKARKFWSANREKFFNSLPKDMPNFTKARLFRSFLERYLSPGHKPEMKKEILILAEIWKAKRLWAEKKEPTSITYIETLLKKEIGASFHSQRIGQLAEILFGKEELAAMRKKLKKKIGKGTGHLDPKIVSRIKELRETLVWPKDVLRQMRKEGFDVTYGLVVRQLQKLNPE